MVAEGGKASKSRLELASKACVNAWDYPRVTQALRPHQEDT